MTHRERFNRIFSFLPVDRIPVYFFGAWRETKARWVKEGYAGGADLYEYPGVQLEGMDPDWEKGMWNIHGLVQTNPIGDMEVTVLSEEGNKRVVRNSIGEEYVERTDGASIPHTLVYPLEPTATSWNRFKRFLDTGDSRRYPADWRQKAAERNEKDVVTTFMGGSLYAWLRQWMGVENLSFLMYDDPVLLEEMISFIADHFIALMKPVLEVTKFDFVYFFEDCCGSYGPLFSPQIYQSLFHKYYRKMINFYKDNGVPYALIDSDGKADQLIPCWLESGFDIIFPVEVGTWNASPAKHREQFGPNLKMLGGINKHLIYGPEALLRAHLEELKPVVDAGGYIPIPDHRIPPNVSYAQMLRYIEIFNDVMN